MPKERRSWNHRLSKLLALIAGLSTLSLTLKAAEAESSSADQRHDQEKDLCINNLKTIYSAIENFRKDNNELPNWFSDLIPRYLSDVTVLMCPVSRRTGKTEGPPLADPKIASSYLFEFCPLPLAGELPGAPTRTRREWKQKQVELLGPGVPIVRCRQHDPNLNLGLDGRIYENQSSWEEVFTNKASLRFLTPVALLTPAANAHLATLQLKIPPRDPQTPGTLLDLTPFYNALTTEPWHDHDVKSDNSLSSLGIGVQSLGGINFDIRGLVQLSGKNLNNGRFPDSVAGIALNQKARKLHFLHAAAFGGPQEEEKQIGSYFISFVGQTTRLEIPIVYGHDLRDWHWQPGETPGAQTLRAVWHGENDVSRRAGRPLRLFLTSWTNLLPDIELDTITFKSAGAAAAPFLLAITVE